MRTDASTRPHTCTCTCIFACVLPLPFLSVPPLQPDPLRTPPPNPFVGAQLSSLPITSLHTLSTFPPPTYLRVPRFSIYGQPGSSRIFNLASACSPSSSTHPSHVRPLHPSSTTHQPGIRTLDSTVAGPPGAGAQPPIPPPHTVSSLMTTLPTELRVTINTRPGPSAAEWTHVRSVLREECAVPGATQDMRHPVSWTGVMIACNRETQTLNLLLIASTHSQMAAFD